MNFCLKIGCRQTVCFKVEVLCKAKNPMSGSERSEQ